MTDFRGGYSELAELVHETGHALHIAGIRTRPAFADWPDSDALTEALADVLALDLTEPAWLRRWLPGAQVVPEATAIRCRYADVVLDAAWAVFELRMHAAPGRRPNDVWTEITGTWLGIAPHPEWSWWAIRGQLVESPGYMSNYAIGAVLATSIRAAMREALGDWVRGDRRWYPWLRDRVYRYGLERPSRDVLHDVLGRAPTADALLAEIGRSSKGT
jgi:Zn-dependent oligopeptidase